MTNELAWTVVDACTLPTAERPLRLGEFDDLFRSSLVETLRPSAHQAVLILAGPEGLAERVRHLADAESSCCSFFTFTVRPAEGPREGTALEIEVPPAYGAVLSALVERAEAVAGQRT